jgi:GNAT superfamily N-acetyltransferase
MDDVMAGHKASGDFVPSLWRLLCQPGATPEARPQPLGVLLLARIPQASAVELVYLGLVSSARGRKLGDLLVKQALAGVIEQGMSRLTLAVDARNAPALKLYYRNGLSRAGMKIAMMRDLRHGQSSGPATLQDASKA